MSNLQIRDLNDQNYLVELSNDELAVMGGGFFGSVWDGIKDGFNAIVGNTSVGYDDGNITINFDGRGFLEDIGLF
jgi:hypothetical protein